MQNIEKVITKSFGIQKRLYKGNPNTAATERARKRAKRYAKKSYRRDFRVALRRVVQVGADDVYVKGFRLTERH